MNQDFRLLLTPAIARRLCLIGKTCNIELPDQMYELAKQDMINEDSFDFACPFSETKRFITQFLLDCNLRGIVQNVYHPEFDETALANTIRLSKPEMITINSPRREVWNNATKSSFLYGITKIYTAMPSSEIIDARRTGVLIIDFSNFDMGRENIHILGMEFSKTLVFDKTEWNSLIPWTVLAEQLFPTMPSGLYPRLVKDVSQSYTETSLHMFARLYNTCIFEELITDTNIRKLIEEDKSMHFRLQKASIY